jgi:Ca2+-binding RTX toxin-like protein
VVLRAWFSSTLYLKEVVMRFTKELRRLFGEAGNDGLYGEANNDTLNGGSGTDYMSGGGGNDDFGSQDGEVDTLDGGSGWDTGFIDYGEVIDEEFSIETLFY